MPRPIQISHVNVEAYWKMQNFMKVI